MRLWSVDVLKFLPDLQFRGQLREMMLILRDWRDKGHTNHLLINMVMEYPKNDFVRYFVHSENAKKRQREGKIQVFEYGGERHGLREWSLITGINQTTLQSRIRSGWSVERALTEKVAK